jgi:imidazolonepropionase-like amidohydrolase
MTDPACRTLFREVRVFPGHGDLLLGPQDVLVEGDRIESVEDSASAPGPCGSLSVIEGAGRVLMPGLIDAHWHAAFASISLADVMAGDTGYVHLRTGVEARRTLLRGFTSVRDAGGPTFAVKRAIDEGLVSGPRMYPSGAMISQTGGHGDFRFRHEVPRDRSRGLSHLETAGGAVIADGVDQVLRAAREQLMLGASQIKLMAGGGIASWYDHIDVTQYTEAELRAAVEAAENWGTYVMAHAYTPRAIAQAVRAGVRSIEHGHLADEATAAMLAEHNTWWSLQPFLDDEDTKPIPEQAGRAKQAQVRAGTDRAYALAREYGVRLAWGTDILFDASLASRQGKQLAKMARWFTPAEVLTMATSTNAELLAVSGPRNPYPGRALGRVEPGAWADLLLVDGNPLDELSLLADPDRNLAVIMKDGVIHKNSLTGARS